jgi:hypothetical protein
MTTTAKRIKIRPFWVLIGLVLITLAGVGSILWEAQRQRALIEEFEAKAIIELVEEESMLPTWLDLQQTRRVTGHPLRGGSV